MPSANEDTVDRMMAIVASIATPADVAQLKGHWTGRDVPFSIHELRFDLEWRIGRALMDSHLSDDEHLGHYEAFSGNPVLDVSHIASLLLQDFVEGIDYKPSKAPPT